jgi:alkylation response protein AidB-like acyl-CoA dehydrogenase
LIATFPSQREEKRLALLEAAESIRGILQAGSEEAERIGTLPQDSVNALYDSGLLSFKMPEELGGAEADLLTQIDVVEAVTRIDPAAGWCLMIGAASVANITAFLSDEAIQELFVDGRPPTAAGAFSPSGKATPVAGGFRVTGRWAFGSGVRHSQWISAGAWLEDNERPNSRQIRLVFPRTDATIHDNWKVMGLQGTGSCDYSVSNIFVPQRFTWDVNDDKPRRGGPYFLLGRPGNVTTGHCAFALGVGRLALDAIIDLAASKARGYGSAAGLVAGRGSFQRALGLCDLRLRAARALVVETLSEAWDSVCQGVTPPGPLQARMRATASFSTEVAADVVSQAFRYGGGTALYQSHVLQRCLRDINAAAQHSMVSDSAYENHAKFALGLPDADPMG